MPWRHQQYQPINLARGDTLQLPGEHTVERRGAILWERIFSEPYQALGRVRSPQQFRCDAVRRH